MRSLGDVLSAKNFSEPKEIGVIKKYVKDIFKSDAQVTIHPKQIVISVNSAALAGTLRLHLHELAKLCQTDKRLTIRIGR